MSISLISTYAESPCSIMSPSGVWPTSRAPASRSMFSSRRPPLTVGQSLRMQSSSLSQNFITHSLGTDINPGAEPVLRGGRPADAHLGQGLVENAHVRCGQPVQVVEQLLFI